ncbi:MAG: ABC transporter substrate-binding protein [Rhodospirillales bacterium]|nr:ABC transporter substrate-binding protein [Rhodospirillales bacterium]
MQPLDLRLGQIPVLESAHAAIADRADRARLEGAGVMYALRTFCTALLLTAAIAVAQPAAATGDASPAAIAFIQELGNDAIKDLTDPAIPQSEREARFRRLLVDRFDMAAISKFVLGRYWRSTNEAQRVEFQQLLVDFIVSSYSVRFSEYLGEGVKVTGSSAEDSGTILVRSKIDMPSSEDIRVDWRLRHADGNFAIVDIIVEGVSMGVTQRSEFASMIHDRGGVNSLIEALRTKNLRFANSSTEQ